MKTQLAYNNWITFIIIAGLLLLTVFGSRAQTISSPDTATVTEITINEAERLADKYIDKASEAIKGLAKALQVPADHLYYVLIKQQKVHAITWLVVSGIFLLLLAPYIFGTIYFYKNEIKSELATSFIVLGGIIVAILVIVVCAHVDIIIMGFVNPEYGAIKEIMEFMKAK